jgi:hypothetical protein
MRREDALHKSIVAHLRARLQKPWMFWHTPNSGIRRSGDNAAAYGGYLKSMGQQSGIPDLFILGPDRHLIAIELKAPPVTLKGGKLSEAKPRISDDQRAVINALGVNGVPTLIIRDLDQCMIALGEMGVPIAGLVR